MKTYWTSIYRKNSSVTNMFLIILCVFTCLTLLVNCSKDNSNEAFIDCNNFDNNFYLKEYENVDSASNVLRIERISLKSPVGIDFLNEIIINKIEINELDLNNILQIFLKNSELSIISVPYKKSNKKIISYNYYGEFILFKSFQQKNHFIIKTLDNKNFYKVSFDHDKEKSKANIYEIHDNVQVNNFSEFVYEKTLEKHYHNGFDEKSYDYTNEAICCRKELTYRECVRCTASDSWLFNVVVASLLPELGAAVLISCIGAGPNAWC